MYFPTSVAKQLSAIPALPNAPEEPVIALAPSSRRSLFCVVTRSAVSLWRVRPPVLLGHLRRTKVSIAEHGENKSVSWAPDGTRLVVQTTSPYLVLVLVKLQSDSSAPYDPSPPRNAPFQRAFFPGPGEGHMLQAAVLELEGVVHVDGGLASISPRRSHLLFSTVNPATVQCMPWPTVVRTDGEAESRTPQPPGQGFENWAVDENTFPWLIDSDVHVRSMILARGMDVESWITSDGRAYFVQLAEVPLSKPNPSNADAYVNSPPLEGLSGAQWHGTCIHDVEIPRWVQKRPAPAPGTAPADFELPRRALHVAVNVRFSLVAVGTLSGIVELANFPTSGRPPAAQQLAIPRSYSAAARGAVCSMEWSSDSYVLAVGFERGWAIWSVAGRCLAWSFGYADQVDESRFQDVFMSGVRDLFWALGDFELIMLAHPNVHGPNGQLFAVPFAKSATTTQHTPDNTEYAFLQMEDRVLVYRGADQPDMSVINPESDVWQHIPTKYLATNWPIHYSCISADGRLIAVAGRRGLVHYSATSGRWKVFADEQQEQAFVVRGGLLWFHHVLVAATEVARSWQIRLFSRDLELGSQNVLHRELLTSAVVTMALVDNSLLVYTIDNTLSHFLVVPTDDSIMLHLCGSMSFDGVIAQPSAVRALSWMIPGAQKQLGDPIDDLATATVLMMVGGQLVLLRPRKTGTHEVSYDMQVLANRIEFCWIHLRGVGSLENSLWGFDGQSMRVWLNALSMATNSSDSDASALSDPLEDVKESVNIPLDFYPLSVLMDKGIIIGAEHEIAARSNLPFVTFRHATSSHLFLHHILLSHLSVGRVREAVALAAYYQDLVFFAHALEILLHTVVESEAEASPESEETSVLPAAVEFLDHFDAALDVVVGCARKTEMTRWRRLFDIVGEPRALFEACLGSGRLRTAGSYLLVLQSLEQLQDGNDDVLRLLCKAVGAKDWQFCKELLRFLHSIDGSGNALREALSQPFMQVTNGVDLEVH
ncbi:RIC1-domain-containing protein [Vararia minispora EC-137]|uniref:RIC1-domain-containing protein n=1 Tax=Vararia minispora EC-137 TaxID=1314806 RepID=A0ACB8QUQ9_9AGAM|nr:RIC1-domain-containing protein [Vararia minispora EC-137]